jgi:glycerol-3-phosphate dehydrogenase
MSPTPRAIRRLYRPLLYLSGASVAGAGVLYIAYRPRDIPGSEPASVPPPFNSDGRFRLPRFPKIKEREAMISDLWHSAAANSKAERSGLAGMLGWFWGPDEKKKTLVDEDNDEPYDLLVIGCGATGAGIALDAATRGLRVAVVERDDFSAGTSSKSTKLVHGGVRYLEKAVWELDYSQYGSKSLQVEADHA